MKFLETSVPVLMYHHIRPEAGFIACTPEHFEQQLQWLSHQGYESLSLAEFAAHLAGETRKKAVVITFDDGYLDNWVYAFPLLQKYGFKATIFLVSGWLHHGEIRANTATAKSPSELPPCPEHAQCEQLIEHGCSDEVILRWSEVKAMIDSGLVEFHCHTHSHTRWDLDPSIDKNTMFRQELRDSKATLFVNSAPIVSTSAGPKAILTRITWPSHKVKALRIFTPPIPSVAILNTPLTRIFIAFTHQIGMVIA